MSITDIFFWRMTNIYSNHVLTFLSLGIATVLITLNLTKKKPLKVMFPYLIIIGGFLVAWHEFLFETFYSIHVIFQTNIDLLSNLFSDANIDIKYMIDIIFGVIGFKTLRPYLKINYLSFVPFIIFNIFWLSIGQPNTSIFQSSLYVNILEVLYSFLFAIAIIFQFKFEPKSKTNSVVSY